MKKLKTAAVILVIVISAGLAISMLGRQMLIKSISQNNKVNNAVEKAETIINDEGMKMELNAFVQQLVDDGVLNEQQIEEYAKVIEREPSLSLNVNGKIIGAAEPDGEAPQQTAQPDTSGKSKTERILSAMTPSEASFAMSVYSKVSVSEVMSLMKTDKAAAKKYVTDRLSADEISRALSLYSKYSYLLRE